MKKLAFTLFCLTMMLTAHGQVAVKTNLPMDALRLPNIGAEVGLAPKWTLDASFYYNPWKFSDQKQHKLLLIQPELRYWLCDKFNGHFFGFHFMAGSYNTMGFKTPFGLWDDMDTFRYKGRFYGGGLSYGYQFILSKHWNLGTTLGFGYNYVTYQKYICKNCGKQVDEGKKNYIGPTKAAINLIYLF